MDATVTQIGAVVVAELRATGYMESTICQYQKTIRVLAGFVEEHGGVYTPTLGAEFASMTTSPRTGRFSVQRRMAYGRLVGVFDSYVLPVRFDDTDLPGLRPTIGYMDARTTEPVEIVAAIATKLRSHEEVDLQRESDEPAAATAWHVDLAILWDEDGKSRYAVTWEPGRGFVQFPEGDAALDGVADTPLPGQYAIEDAIGVGHLRGKHLKFDFESPASPVIAYLHHGDNLHKPTGVGGGADEFVEFSLKLWDEIV